MPMTRPAYEDMLFGGHKESDSTRHNRYVMQKLPKEAQWISADGTRIVELPYKFD